MIPSHQKQKLWTEEEIAKELKELRDKGAFYQIFIKGENGHIDEVTVSEKKFKKNDHQ